MWSTKPVTHFVHYCAPSFYIRHLLALLMSLPLLTACLSSRPPYPAFPVAVTETIERLEIFTYRHQLQLSDYDLQVLTRFLQNYKQFGEGQLHLNIPRPLIDTTGLQQAEDLIYQTLIQTGNSSQVLQKGQYPIPALPVHTQTTALNAPIVLSYRQLESHLRDCPSPLSLTETGHNQPYPSFGCAQAHNLAAMIEPRQFLHPYTTSLPDTQRRMIVYGRYIEGANTTSEQPPRQNISATENGG